MYEYFFYFQVHFLVYSKKNDRNVYMEWQKSSRRICDWFINSIGKRILLPIDGCLSTCLTCEFNSKNWLSTRHISYNNALVVSLPPYSAILAMLSPFP